MRYEENPFVEVEALAQGVWSLLSPGGCPTLCYLVEGTDNALLIDTGFGVGDLAALCARLTDRPLLVADTHAHGDHVMGNFQFAQVYVHPLDLKETREMDRAESRARFMEAPAGCGYALGDYVPFKPYELVPMAAGHVFDLGGGHEVEVIHTPGHTAGGVCLLERKRRMLFSGDSLVRTPTLLFFGDAPECTVEAYREGLLALQARRDAFDGIYPGHFETPQPKELLDDMVTLCGLILEAPEKYDDWQDMFGNPRYAKRRRWGRAAIAFDDAHVYRKK